MMQKRQPTLKQLEALARGRKLGASAGGKALHRKYGSVYLSKIGRKGYEVMVDRHHAGDKSKAGRAGYMAMVNHHFNGDRTKADTWLSKYANWANDADYRNKGMGAFPNPGPHPAQYVEDAN